MLRWLAIPVLIVAIVVVVLVTRGGDDSPPRVRVGGVGFPGVGGLIGDHDLLASAAKAWQTESAHNGVDLSFTFHALWAGMRGRDRLVILDNGAATASVLISKGRAHVLTVEKIPSGLLNVRKIADGLLLKPDAPDEFQELSRSSDGTITRATVRPVNDIVRVPDSGGPVALLGRRTADETPLYVLPGSAPGAEYSVRGADYEALDAALTDGRDGPLTLSALARAAWLNKPDAPGRTASVIHRDGDGVAVLVRGLDPAGIVFASGTAAIGSTHADVIGAGIPGQDPAQAPLGAAYVLDDDAMSLVVAGDPQIRRLVIETGKQTLRRSGSFARIPARDLAGDGARPAVSVRGYLADGTVIPAGGPAT